MQACGRKANDNEDWEAAEAALRTKIADDRPKQAKTFVAVGAITLKHL